MVRLVMERMQDTGAFEDWKLIHQMTTDQLGGIATCLNVNCQNSCKTRIWDRLLLQFSYIKKEETHSILSLGFLLPNSTFLSISFFDIFVLLIFHTRRECSWKRSRLLPLLGSKLEKNLVSRNKEDLSKHWTAPHKKVMVSLWNC